MNAASSGELTQEIETKKNGKVGLSGDRRRPVNKVLIALFTLLILHESAHAIDKVRIGFPDMAAQFMPVPLGQKLGLFQEEGLQAEFIRINPTPAMAALVS